MHGSVNVKFLKLFVLSWVSVSSLWICIYEAPGLSAGLVTDYPDWDFSLFSVDFPGECPDSGLKLSRLSNPLKPNDLKKKAS